jgi:bacterioferritin
MKGSPRVIEALNSLLADELSAVNQYMVHAEMCENWNYGKIHGVIQKRAIDEMKHAETLIGRILFLEGKPVVNVLRPMSIGADVSQMFANDNKLEEGAIKAYNSFIQLCGEEKDYATREILERILNDEDRHMDEIEGTQDQISQMGIQVFLSTRTD